MRITSVFLLILPLLLGMSCVNQGEDSAKPNIIIITVDDLGWSDVGYNGSTFYETPHIDEIAAQSTVFTNAYAAAAVCSPTRAALQTGKYPARLGITDWIRASFQGGKRTEVPSTYVGGNHRKLLCPRNPYWLELDEVTIAELLQSNGYKTGHIGKWHLGWDEYMPHFQGYEANIGGCDFGQPPSYFDPYSTNSIPGGIPRLNPRQEGEYLTDREAAEAIKFITRNAENPFFLNLSHYAVHTPIQAKEDKVEYFKAKEADSLQNHAEYAAMISSVDDSFGEIIAVLKELDILKNTIIIFTSDNGGHNAYTSNAPLRSGKGNPWEGGIRVPMFVYYPFAETVKESDTYINSIDLLPSICELTKTPFNDSLIDGVNIAPLLSGAEIEERSMFWHFPHYRDYERVKPYSIIRNGDFKLIKWWEGRMELYNLVTDPSESNNIANLERDKVRKMEQELNQWLHRIKARKPVNNPEWFKKQGQ